MGLTKANPVVTTNRVNNYPPLLVNYERELQLSIDILRESGCFYNFQHYILDEWLQSVQAYDPDFVDRDAQQHLVYSTSIPDDGLVEEPGSIIIGNIFPAEEDTGCLVVLKQKLSSPIGDNSYPVKLKFNSYANFKVIMNVNDNDGSPDSRQTSVFVNVYLTDKVLSD